MDTVKNDLNLNVRTSERRASFTGIPDAPRLESLQWMQPPLLKLESSLIEVRIRFAVKVIQRISTVDGTALIRLGIVLYWKDSRLIGWPLNEALPPHLWCPKILIMNKEVGFQTSPDGLHLMDTSNGLLKRGYNYDGNISNPQEDMMVFPFDLDALDIRLYTESNWEIADGSVSGMEPLNKTYVIRPVIENTGQGKLWWYGWDGSIDEWKLHGQSYFIEEHPPTSSGTLGTSIHLKFHLSRIPGFYVIKCVIPLIVLWQMQFYTFFIRKENNLEARLSHISTLLLTTCAFVYVITAFLPKLAFLTMIDRTVQLLFITITINGWLEIVSDHVFTYHSNMHKNFIIIWFSINLIVFLYFQIVHYVLPYRRLVKARNLLNCDSGHCVTRTDNRFIYNTLEINEKQITYRGSFSAQRQSQKKFNQVSPRKSFTEFFEKVF